MPVIIATTLGVLMVIGGQVIDANAVGATADSAEELVRRESHALETILSAAVRAIGFLLLTVPLLSMFISARDRSEEPIGRYRTLVAMGPPLLGLGTLLSGIGLAAAAKDFVAGAPTSGDAAIERADDVVADVVLGQIGAGAVYAGLLATAFGLLYTARKSLQTGLVTSFWGTLGMAFGAALGVSFLAPPLLPIGIFGFLVWLIHVTLLTSGRSRRPPAWDAGVALPWPKPGEQAVAPEPEEELARPEDFEGDEGEGSSGSGSTALSAQRPTRRDNKRKRKRKQRS